MEEVRPARRFLILWGVFLLCYVLAGFMVWKILESDRRVVEDRCLLCYTGDQNR